MSLIRQCDRCGSASEVVEFWWGRLGIQEEAEADELDDVLDLCLACRKGLRSFVLAEIAAHGRPPDSVGAARIIDRAKLISWLKAGKS